MKKIIIWLAAFALLFGSACNININNSKTYPDQLSYAKGSTEYMTIFKCGALYYGCPDGSSSWEKLVDASVTNVGDDEFIYGEVDYELVYGGIAGYRGNKTIKKIKNVMNYKLDEVIDSGSILPYDENDFDFQGLRYAEVNGDYYLIVRDGLGKYRVYNKDCIQLGEYDSGMSAAGSLGIGKETTADVGSSANLPFYVMNINGVYYAYSSHIGFNHWVQLLNMDFENKPIGFTLGNGQVMKVSSTRVYPVNGGEENYVDAPMFSKMENTERVGYDILNRNASEKHWEEGAPYEEGNLYQYFNGNDNYLIFYLDRKFVVYHQKSTNMDNVEYAGSFDTVEEVNEILGM